MTNEIIIAEAEAWDIRPMGGVDRISGTELGRRLAYSVADPTKFNKQVVEKLLKAGKINDSDIALEQAQCAKGFGGTTITEYWLPLPIARRIALEHVRTKVADGLRQQVTAQLEKLIQQRTTALKAAPDPVQLMTRVLEAMESQTTKLTAALTMTIERVIKAPATPETSLCVDSAQVWHLQGQARALSKVTGKSVTRIWRELSDHEGIGRKGKAFSTVLRAKFDAVSSYLRELLDAARASNRSQVIDHPHLPKVEPARPANGTDLGVQIVAQRLIRELGYPVPAEALSRVDGIYDVSGVDPLYLAVKGKAPRIKTRPAPFLDESRYTHVAHWMRANPLWAHQTIRLVMRAPVTAMAATFGASAG